MACVHIIILHTAPDPCIYVSVTRIDPDDPPALSALSFFLFPCPRRLSFFVTLIPGKEKTICEIGKYLRVFCVLLLGLLSEPTSMALPVKERSTFYLAPFQT